MPHSLVKSRCRPSQAVVLAACLTLLAACQSSTPPKQQAQATNQMHALARSLGNTIGRCWFADGETAFAGYIYSPEPNAVQPRILIVPKDQPAERPLLVVEASGAASVSTYGPLLDTPNGPRIRSDLDRWAKGSESCS
jgi:hypothetical protein